MGNGRSGGENSGKMWRFGAYEVESSTGEVRKYGHRLKLAGQPLDVLVLLLERAGELVSREELRTLLWPQDIYVDFEHSLNTIVKKIRRTLDDNPETPKYIETVPRKGYRFIADIEVVETPPAVQLTAPAIPADTIENVVVPPSSVPIPPSPTSIGRESRWKYAAGLALLGIVIFAAAIAVTQKHKREARSTTTPTVLQRNSSSRPSIAVLGFQNLSPDRTRDWLSTAFTQLLTTELERGGRVRTIPEEVVSRAKRDLRITERDGYARSTLRSVRADLGTDYVIAGSYLPVGAKDTGQIRLDLRLQETLSGETMASIAVSGNQSGIFELVARAADELRSRVGGTIPPEGDVDWRTVVPANPEAARLYSEGLQRLRRFENVPASELLQGAVALEPTFALAHASLAEAWQSLGYTSRALEAAREAFNLSSTLPEDERLKVHGRYYELQNDWDGALAAYQHLWHDFPDDIDSALRLIEVQLSAGKVKEAHATISNLRSLPRTISNDPRVDLVEASLAAHNADFTRQQQLAAQAAQKSREMGARLLEARANLVEGWAYDDQSKFPEALRMYVAAQKIFEEAGDLDGAATAMNDIGIIRQKQGELADAHSKLERAQQIFRQLGDENGLAGALTNLGEVDRARGDLNEAEECYRTALRISRETGRKDRESVAMNNLGGLMYQRGDFRSAKQIFEQLLQVRQAEHDNVGIAFAKVNLADVLRVEADLENALAFASDAIATFVRSGDRESATSSQFTLARAQIANGDLAEAKRTLQQALATSEQIGAKGDAALARVLLAEVGFRESHLDHFDEGFAQAIAELRSEHRDGDEMEALTLEIRAAIERHDFASAQHSSKRARALRNADWITTFYLGLAEAKLAESMGSPSVAQRQLSIARASAEKAGCKLCAKEMQADALRASKPKPSTILEGKVVVP